MDYRDDLVTRVNYLINLLKLPTPLSTEIRNEMENIDEMISKEKLEEDQDGEEGSLDQEQLLLVGKIKQKIHNRGII